MSTQEPVPGGGPREGEEVKADHLNPDAVHPDFQQTMPGDPAPAPTSQPASEQEDDSSDDED